MSACRALAEAMMRARELVLIAHISPDGDTLGSCLALQFAAEGLGKRVIVLCQEGVPAKYRLLPGWERVRGPGEYEGVPDLAVAVDVAERARMGECAEIFDTARVTAVLDHHGSNTGFGQVCWIEPGSAATGVMAYALLREMGVVLTSEIAECLYVAISTDTGHFMHRNFNAQAMRAALECVEVGIDAVGIVDRLYRTRSVEQTRLLARALSSLRLFLNGRLSVMRLSRRDYEECGANGQDTETIIDHGIAVEGTLMACLIAQRDGEIRVSLRARPPADAGRVALRFGGGGHTLAAGCTFAQDLDHAERLLLEAIKEQME